MVESPIERISSLRKFMEKCEKLNDQRVREGTMKTEAS